MPEANTVAPATKTVEAVKAPVAKVETKKTYETVGPVTEEDVVEGIRALITDWSEQNQGVAKIDVVLGSFRTIVQTERTPVVD